VFAILKSTLWKISFALFRICNFKTISIASVFFALYSIAAFAMKCNADETNPAFATICEVIMFMQGRIGRSIATFSIMMSAWAFTNGKLKWQEIVTTALGVGLFFAPKTLALFLLPNVVTGLSGGFDIDKAYSPDEILSCMCPNLR
jgi:type IV secretory pathway VirB2 component (pilin)